MISKLILLISQAIEIYSYCILVWIIGSWFPQFQATKFYRYLDSIVYPYTSIFRRFIPPLGGFDFSVVVAFIVLGFIRDLLVSLLSGIPL